MKILVTGGAGFIGSHVCDQFVRNGHEVLALDNLSSGVRENVPPGAKLIELDIRSPDIPQVIAREKPNVICHLAAQMDVRRSVSDPKFDADCNIVGMLNLLESARAAGVSKFLFSSTGGAIYGEQDVFPAPESHAVRPLSPYGVSKASGELYLNYYRAQYGLQYVALRYANVYGPRQNPHGEAGVVAIFSERLIAGKPCAINGDGGQTRDFVYAGDVARSNYLAFEKDFNGPINIGTGIETDINELYRQLAKAAGSGQQAAHAPAKLGEQRRSSIDNALARRALGWTPKVSLPEGIRLTVEFFRARAAKGANA